jgi:hypothetical protein
MNLRSQISNLKTRGACAAALLALTLGALPAMTAAPKHPTNYDEAEVGQYTLPDLLTSQSGEKVRTVEDWNARRRPELVRLYENEVFGRVPGTAPFVRTEVVADNEPVENGLGVRRHVILHFGDQPNGPHADLVIYFPGRAGTPLPASSDHSKLDVGRSMFDVRRGAAPALLQIVFLKGLPTQGAEPEIPVSASSRVGFPKEFTEIGPVADILRRGYAYATFKYTDVQPDDADTRNHGVIALSDVAGDAGSTSAEPTADTSTPRGRGEAWSTIGAWAWAASRVLDYLSTEPAIDAKRVALIGHSRLGKTALWASAQDPRFALVFASCSGEMGAALSRRDYGETIDDIATMFPWWFCGNFQKYVGHWNDLPVDAHSLIALSAPRPVFITAGTEDQWADPRGEFLAAAATEPVYQLFGLHAFRLSPSAFPEPDHALLDGQIGWLYHAGPHAITDLDWQTFLSFADRHLRR